jgi:hypothetical protein
VGPRTSLDVFVEETNILSLLSGLEHWIIQPVIRSFCSSLSSVFSGSYMVLNHGLLWNTLIPRLTSDPANEFFG